jgi:hypothetical protein
MLILAAIFLFLALIAFADRLGWITGKPVINAGYYGAIITVLFIMVLFCIVLTWKLACPVSDKWLNLECFEAAGIWKGF